MLPGVKKERDCSQPTYTGHSLLSMDGGSANWSLSELKMGCRGMAHGMDLETSEHKRRRCMPTSAKCLRQREVTGSMSSN